MIKKLLLSSLFIFTASIVFAASPVPPVDPEKKDKEQIEEKKEVVKEEINEEYQHLAIPEKPTAKAKETSQKEAQVAPSDNNDVQSFNFLYYIIHNFKFSDFIPQ